MNKTTLIGNLSKKPEKAFTQDGKECSKFTVAVSNGNYTEFIECVAWDKLATTCNMYLDKGKKVAVEGELRSSKWEDSTGRTHLNWRVRVNYLEMLSPKEQPTSTVEFVEEKPLPKQTFENYSYKQAMDDDVPF